MPNDVFAVVILGFAMVVVVMVEAIVVDVINGTIEELIVVLGMVVNRVEAVEVVESIIEAIVEDGEPVVNGMLEVIVVVVGPVVDVVKVVEVVELVVDTVVVMLLMVEENNVVEEMVVVVVVNRAVVVVVVVNGAVVDVEIAAVVEAEVEVVVVELVVVNWVEIVVLIGMGENPEAFSKIFSQKEMFWAKEFCVKKITQKNKMKNFMTILGVYVNC